jgi:hypothetical protein
MARGEHIRVKRIGYWHHGVDCGDGTVIHYNGELFRSQNATVCRVSMGEFARDGEVRVVHEPFAYEPDRVVQRAEERLGEDRYSALANNCEHFARWCVTGIEESRQVERALYIASGLAVTAAGVLTSLVVAKVLTAQRQRFM